MRLKSKKIAFTGPFADVNFGDYAMLINNIYDLKVKDIILFSYDNEFLNKITAEYLSDYDIDIVEIKMKQELLSENRNILTPIEILYMISNYDQIKEKIKDIDVLIVNGGGYFNSLWSMPHRILKLLKIIAPVLIANQLNKKIIFTGNGYGPFAEDVELFESIFGILDNASFGSRDNLYSPIWAKQIGIKEGDMQIVPDDLFIINSEILQLPKSNSINFEKYIVMETYLPLEYIEKNVDKFKEFSQSIYQKYGLGIVFLPFNLKHGGMDQAKYLNKVLDNYKYVDISTKGYLPIQDAVEIIKNAELVVSSRYHAVVLAVGVGTPTVSALKDVLNDKRYYYNKNNGILKLVLNKINYDERYYIGLNYLETLDFINKNYNEIIEHQRKNYNIQYKENKIVLNNVRRKYLDKIL